MPKIINWSRGKFNLESNNEIKNGVIALKGGDINEELLSINNPIILPIEEILDNKRTDDYKTILEKQTNLSQEIMLKAIKMIENNKVRRKKQKKSEQGYQPKRTPDDS